LDVCTTAIHGEETCGVRFYGSKGCLIPGKLVALDGDAAAMRCRKKFVDASACPDICEHAVKMPITRLKGNNGRTYRLAYPCVCFGNNI
jgi:hypothetical protein